MKNYIIFSIIFNLLIGCSFIESKSFYKTFVNPELEIEIDNNQDNGTPDLESVPEGL